MPSSQVSQLLDTAMNAHRRGDIKAAIPEYLRVISLAPTNSVAIQLLGACYLQLNRFAQARESFEAAIKLDANYGDAFHNLARLDEAEHDLDAAEKNYRRAHALVPSNADTVFSLANVLKAKGELAESEQLYRKTIELSPSYAPAHRQLARLIDHLSVDDDIQAMEALIAAPSTPSNAKMHLAFGLGKCFEDLGLFERAMTYFNSANRLMRDQLRFDINQWDKEVDHIIASFTPELFAQAAESPNTKAEPLFILGMPRSGTSLVEQILASHSKVYGGGELQNLNIAIMANMDVRGYPQNISKLDPQQLALMATQYLDSLSNISEKSALVSDKKPDNFKLIGMIKLMFPRARVIHCCRDPLDTCLSLFKNHFSERGPFYSYDQRELGQYYLGYQRLMRHWQSVLPGFVYDVSYEGLVQDPAAGIRRLLELCRLDFEPACLDFHQSKRSVQTASAVQVRKPIYSKSVLLSQKYGDDLNPLKIALGYSE